MRRDLVAGLLAALLLFPAAVTAGASVERLVSRLKSGTPKVRVQAAVLLGKSGDRAAVQALVDAIGGDDSEAVRAAAAGALGVLRATSARGPLEETSRTDPSPIVRTAARRALELLHDGGGATRVALDALGGKLRGARGAGFRRALAQALGAEGFAVVESTRTEAALRRELGAGPGRALVIKPAILALHVREDGGRTVISCKVSGMAVEPSGRVASMSEATAKLTVGAAGMSAEERAQYEDQALAAAARNLAVELKQRL